VKTIYKYTLSANQMDVLSRLTLTLPVDSKPLSVGAQGSNIVLWAEVDTTAEGHEEWDIWVHGTGHQTYYPVLAKFLGTASMMNGDLVFHVFAKKLEAAK
jgi:hypothetical protein